MPTKPKLNQPETPDNVQQRDSFQTPNYATELLIPFIPKNISTIWECACGDYKISKKLESAGYSVISTDLKYGTNFLESKIVNLENTAIVTNPPYSLKQKFYRKCREYNIPFALLIPCDYCGWIIEALQNGAEKIIPTRRIDYITPNCISRINNRENTKYESVAEIDPEHLKKDAKKSASQFHSMWLTWGFNLGKSETFVELTKEMKQNI